MGTRSQAASSKFRQRKLNTRQALSILREDQVESIHDEAQRHVQKVETGVEKGEEIVSSRTCSLAVLRRHLSLFPNPPRKVMFF